MEPHSHRRAARKQPPRPTLSDRFREPRDEITAQSSLRKLPSFYVRASWEMRCGPFLIVFTPPGGLGPRRGYNLHIWPGGKIVGGHLVLGPKVANIDWVQCDNIYITSFRSGPWEAELRCLLRGEADILPFG